MLKSFYSIDIQLYKIITEKNIKIIANARLFRLRWIWRAYSPGTQTTDRRDTELYAPTRLCFHIGTEKIGHNSVKKY